MVQTSVEAGIRKFSRRLFPVFVVGTVVAIFSRAVGFNFVNFDDPLYVTENVKVQAGLSWDNVRWAFTSVNASNWHPLTWLSHMLDVELFELKPWGHHLVSILIHAANSLLLFLWLNRILKREEGTATHAASLSTLAALLFALHPLRVESVAWIAERKDVLSGFFWLLALVAYDFYCCKPAFSRYAGVLLAFLLGLMSKSMVVTLPAMLLLLDYWPLRRSGLDGQETHRRSLLFLLVEKVPLFALALGTGLVAFLTQRSGTAMADLATIPLFLRLENALVSYARYVWMTFWPMGLAVFYPFPRQGLPFVSVVLAGAFIACVTGLAFAWRKRMPFLLLGWLWYLVTLLPVIGIVQIGAQASADRYTYLPGIGLLLAVVPTTWSMVHSRRLLRAGYLAFGIACVIVLAALTRHQLESWRDSVSLWNRAIAVTDGNWRAHYNLGNTYFHMKRREDAARHYAEAVRIDPNHYNAHANLGSVLCQLGRMPEGIGQLRIATQLKPSKPEFHKLLAAELLKAGLFAEAADHLQEALQLDADGADARINLAIALANLGQLPQAEEQLKEVLRISVENDDARFNLANLYLMQRRYAEALECFALLCESRPADPEAHFGMALALSGTGKKAEALAEAQETLRLHPHHEGAHRLAAELEGPADSANIQ